MNFRRNTTRPVSYYALFKGWLLLSQPPGCLCSATSFSPLSRHLGTLAGGLGCFPLGTGVYPPAPDSGALTSTVFGVCLGLVTLWGPAPKQCSTPATKRAGLYLNIFRGEPDIAELD